MQTPSLTTTRSEMTDAERWQAVEARAAGADGRFVYAVRSTGIYCRPSCPSRRPGREQTVFFPDPATAEDSGFRPCRRCRPEQAIAPRAELVRRTSAWIEEHVDESPTLADLGQALGVSPAHLQRTFKQSTGVSPRQYAEAVRLERIKARLKEGDDVTTALYDAGYGSSSSLYERAPAALGMTPRTYGRRGEGMAIGYAIADCSLGRVLVAATARGICAVSFGEGDRELAALLEREYPAADVRRDGDALEEWVRLVVARIDGDPVSAEVPLDVRATAFQARVWAALRRIPRGEVRSYGQVAAELGEPSAVRAVATACASNPAAVVIPCHRVVRSDGTLGGYRWGTERKQRLLERERSAVPA
ncbi:MAG TPA: bifunctional DNA-binding transcriptional regulator/O6-methylguanine-DNA methyltransferase Ada [Thermomicrobiaceae bacterium]|nr:bifunctional DNA-binding transcriptional regulator/O6-methylguanine-DNA methyltransferase Ada [Thermomicrobiaceae bacterium]